MPVHCNVFEVFISLEETLNETRAVGDFMDAFRSNSSA